VGLHALPVVERANRDVRAAVERVPSPGGPPGHGRDDRFGHRAHEALHLQDVQAPRPCRVDVGGRLTLGVAVTIAPADPLIAAGAEGPSGILGARAVPREDDGGDVGAHPGVVKGSVEFIHGVGAEGVAHLRAVECDTHHGQVLLICAGAINTAVVGDIGEFKSLDEAPSGGIEGLGNFFRQSTHAPTLRRARGFIMVKPAAEGYRGRTVSLWQLMEDVMAKVPTQADVVIVGAGIAGNSIAWQLADMGRRHIVLLEKGPLPDPGGATGHASNFVFPVDHSNALTDLTLASVRQYTALAVLHDCGGLEVARTQERYAEFQRRLMSARSWGIEAHLVSPKEIGELVPYIDAGLLVGGFYTPSGAIVNPVEAGRIMRERAEELGALTTCENVEVTGFDVRGGRVQSVRTSAGEIAADVVVLACGVWSPKVAALGGATIPLTPAVHQMIDVGPIPEFEGSEWISFPLVRDMDNKMYERQRGPNLEIGSYAHRPILHEPDEIPRVGESEQASPTSFPFTPEDFSSQL